MPTGNTKGKTSPKQSVNTGGKSTQKKVVKKQKTIKFASTPVVVGDSHYSKRYARALVSPYEHAVRVPSAFKNESALLKTRRDIIVKLDSSGGVVDNRFAVIVQPKLGDPSDPSSFQIGYVNFGVGANPDLTDQASFHKYNETGTSLSLDVNSKYITQVSPRVYAMITDTGTAAQPLLGLANADYPVPVGPRVTMTYGGTWHVTQQAAASLLKIDPGSYFVAMKTTSSAAAASASQLLITVVAGNNDSNVGYCNMIDPPIGVANGEQVSYHVLNVTEFDTIRMAANPAWGGVVTRLDLIIIPLCSPRLSWSSDYGLVEKIRPVGMSVLTTCVLPQLTAGGTIYSMLVPADSKDKIYEGDWLSNGQFNFRGYFSGPLAKGNYTWWKPDSFDDVKFKSISEANKSSYPTILVKGELPPGISIDAAVVKMTIEFVYEVIHSSQLLEQKTEYGDTDIFEKGILQAASVSSYSHNPKHESLLGDIGNIMEQGSKFLPLIARFL